jgi:hypothetical protein
MNYEIRMPVGTRRFFQGAAWAIVLSACCWAMLGAAYFGLASYLPSATTPMTIASTTTHTAGPLSR